MCYNADNIVCWPIYRPLYFAGFYEVEHCNKHYLGDLVAGWWRSPVRLLELPSSLELQTKVSEDFTIMEDSPLFSFLVESVY